MKNVGHWVIARTRFQIMPISGNETIKLIILEIYEKWNCLFSPGVYLWTRRVKSQRTLRYNRSRNDFNTYRGLKSNKSRLRWDVWELPKTKAKLREGVSVEHVRRNLITNNDTKGRLRDFRSTRVHVLHSRLCLSNCYFLVDEAKIITAKRKITSFTLRISSQQ